MSGERQRRGETGPAKILEYTVKCPVCGADMRVEEYIYDMPGVGKVILTSGRCPRCGYRFSNVGLAETRGPVKITYRVEKPDDVNALVIRAATATIRVPELGLEIKPGPAAQGYITTVEGIMLDFIDKLDFMCSEPDAPRDKCIEKRRELEKARDGAIPYTLELYDPEGASHIQSKKAVVTPLSRREEDREAGEDK